MCDKNYTCRKNPHKKPHVESSFSNDDSSTSVNAQIPKQKTKNTIELYSNTDKFENETFVDQPCSKNFSQTHSCCPIPKNHVTFANENLTLPPSFNLQSAQKSTPKRQASRADCSLNSPSDLFYTANSSTQIANSPSQSTNSQPLTANLPSQTVVSIENANDIETIV